MADMGKAIAFFSVLVVLSFAFVSVQLWMRRKPGGTSMRRQPPVLLQQEDGSFYALDLKLSQFAARLEREERRSQKLQADLAQVRRERDQLQEEVSVLDGEVARLKRRLTAPPPQPVAPIEPAPDPGAQPPELTPGAKPAAPGNG
jgi:Tfp pilus assembly protein PilN